MNVREKILGPFALKGYREKKSETLEVRLGYRKKTAFMAACKTEGKTASAVVRNFIDGYLDKNNSAFVRIVGDHKRKIAAVGTVGLLALTFASVTAPSSAGATMLMRIMDTNHDGVISLADENEKNRKVLSFLVSSMDKNADGAIDADELKKMTVSTEFTSFQVSNATKLEANAGPVFSELLYFANPIETEDKEVAQNQAQ
ncbi:MAG: hypothetical protein JKY60_01715 [Kordiimonadaceae bacterium]|nr:hypothetical protein [Kordiimonadaceae bacterium]